MLHGMIPAAFFATLLRRYLDSLSETSSEYAASSSTLGCLETSALVATVGMAAYGISRLSRNKLENPLIEGDETIRPNTPPKKESCCRINRKPSGKVTRKRHRKNKKWFLKHMRHYKSKYGRQIGKLMNQYLGVPLAEPSASELMDLEESDDDDDVDLQPFACFESPPYNGDTDERSAMMAATFNVEDSAAPSKDRFEDDDDSDGIEVIRKKSSSLDLKDLLRSNFEMQKKRGCERKDSFESVSQQSLSSSGSYKSGCSEDNMIHHSKSSIGSRRSGQISGSREQQNKNRPRKKRQLLTNTRRTRSGRCYCKSSP